MTQPSTTRRKFLQWLGLAAAMPAIAKTAPTSEPWKWQSDAVGADLGYASAAVDPFKVDINNSMPRHWNGAYVCHFHQDPTIDKLQSLGKSIRQTEESIIAKAFKR